MTDQSVKAALPQIIERIQAMAQGGVRSLRLSLRPENLGQVELRLTLVGSHLNVQIAAESAQVREALHQNSVALREALAGGGLEVRGIDISSTGSGGAGDDGGANPFRGSRNRALWDEVAGPQTERSDLAPRPFDQATGAKRESLPARLARLLSFRI